MVNVIMYVTRMILKTKKITHHAIGEHERKRESILMMWRDALGHAVMRCNEIYMHLRESYI